MIEGTQIKKSYGTLPVLKGVDISIHKGEIVSIMGKSGAGKSTLLHILGTLDEADSGDIRIDGISLMGLKGKALDTFRNEKIGFIFQFHHLLPEFNALENVSMPALIGQKNKAIVQKKAAELLDYLGLTERMTHKPNQMSGGEQQRVAVARALINAPAVVFADEPTGNLDSQSSAELHQLLLRLKADFQQTFVIVTHNHELSELSDRTLHMKDGLLY